MLDGRCVFGDLVKYYREQDESFILNHVGTYAPIWGLLLFYDNERVDSNAIVCLGMDGVLRPKILIAYGERTGLICLSATAGH